MLRIKPGTLLIIGLSFVFLLALIFSSWLVLITTLLAIVWIRGRNKWSFLSLPADQNQYFSPMSGHVKCITVRDGFTIIKIERQTSCMVSLFAPINFELEIVHRRPKRGHLLVASHGIEFFVHGFVLPFLSSVKKGDCVAQRAPFGTFPLGGIASLKIPATFTVKTTVGSVVHACETVLAVRKMDTI